MKSSHIFFTTSTARWNLPALSSLNNTAPVDTIDLSTLHIPLLQRLHNDIRAISPPIPMFMLVLAHGLHPFTAEFLCGQTSDWLMHPGMLEVRNPRNAGNLPGRREGNAEDGYQQEQSCWQHWSVMLWCMRFGYFRLVNDMMLGTIRG